MRPILIVRAARAAAALCLLGSTSVCADEDLQARLDKGEIVITTRPVAGSNLPEATVQAVIAAPPERLWRILEDCGNYQKNMQRVVRSRELSRQGQKVVCEVEIGLPFPLANLVGVTEATHVVGPPKWSRTWHLLRGDYHVNDGSWTLTRFQDDPKRTLAVYRLHAVPKSLVPDALLRKGQRDTLPKLMQHLRDITSD